MSIEFKLPELGENIESGDVVNVLVREGDVIEGNQGVVELETDKAVIEVPCPHAGKVEKILVGKGDTVKVGQVLLTIDGAAEAEPQAPADQEPPAKEKAPAKKSEPAKKSAPAELAPVAAPPSPAPAAEGGPIPAGPAARRLAREMGVDLARVAGSGARGRITVEDIEAAGSGRGAAPPAAPIGRPVVPPGTPGNDNWGSIRVEKMSKIRRTIAAQMVKSVSTAPHVTNFDDADITVLEEMRKSIPKGYLGEEIKLTVMPFVMKAVAASLRQHPVLNASIDDEKEQVVYKEYVNLGIAVDTPRGLVVPVMRGVDRMTIGQIAGELAKLAGKARDVSFAVEDLRGGTFTISNLGAVGGTYSTPVINHPEVAILLLGRSRWMPIVRDGNVETRFMMPLSLSYDHRLVDGAAAGRFLNQVIDYLETPAKLLITG